MDTKNAEYLGIHDLSSLKPLMTASGPCVSVYLPLSSAPPEQARKMDALTWQGLVAQLPTQEHTQSISDWENIRKALRPGKAQSVAVFRSPEAFYVAGLHNLVDSRAVSGPQFYVRPLLKEATSASRFYLLALSQNDVRLLRCTLDSSEEVSLADHIATSFSGFMASAEADGSRARGAAAGAGSGSSKGITGTTSTERESKNQYLAHFFKQIDSGVNGALQGQSDPLVLAGVASEAASYKAVNSYPHLAEEFVRGAPNGLKAGEMHSRAIAALQQQYAGRVSIALAEYDHKAGGGATNRLKDIVTAAHDGRVTTLVISETAENRGDFDDATNAASGKAGGDIDLINDAAIQTVLHAGTVLVAPSNKIPQGAPAVAIYRY